MWTKTQKIAFLIASNFVIHPQILIFSAFKIAIISPYWLEIKCSMLLFFYSLFWSIFGTGNSSQQTWLQCLAPQESTWYSATRTRFW